MEKFVIRDMPELVFDCVVKPLKVVSALGKRYVYKQT